MVKYYLKSIGENKDLPLFGNLISFSTLGKKITIKFCSVCFQTLCETILDHKVHCVHLDREGFVTHSSYKFQFLGPFVPVYHFLKGEEPSSVHMLKKNLMHMSCSDKRVFFSSKMVRQG